MAQDNMKSTTQSSDLTFVTAEKNKTVPSDFYTLLDRNKEAFTVATSPNVDEWLLAEDSNKQRKGV